jgi:hypothetical protein
MHRTKVDATLESLAEEHADDPQRVELLHRARRFKASWIELAEGLTDARRHGHWRRWGFVSLDEYAKTELHLRPETVEKLTGSFQFLKSKAPDVLRRDGVSAPIPSYQSVDFLRRAEARTGADLESKGDVMEALRKRVLDEAAAPAAIAREFKAAVFPIDEATRKEQDAAALRNVAKRLKEILGDTRAVPRRLAGEVGEALEKLLTALGKGEDAAFSLADRRAFGRVRGSAYPSEPHDSRSSGRERGCLRGRARTVDMGGCRSSAGRDRCVRAAKRPADLDLGDNSGLRAGRREPRSRAERCHGRSPRPTRAPLHDRG